MGEAVKTVPNQQTRTAQVQSKFTPKRDGTVQAKVALLRHGRTNVEAEMTLAHAGGWDFHPKDPSLTVHTRMGTLRVAGPKPQSRPKVTIGRDGSIVLDLSLFNRAGVHVSMSVQLRHRDGWHFSPERPEITVRPGTRHDKVSCRFYPSLEHACRPGDEVTVQVQMDGLPVADATVKVRASGTIAGRLKAAPLSVLVLSLPVVLLGTGLVVLADRSFEVASASAEVSFPSGQHSNDGQTSGTVTGDEPTTTTGDLPPIVSTPAPPPTTSTSTTSTTVLTTVNPPPPCPLKQITDILRGLPDLPVVGNLQSLINLDQLDCLAITNLEDCLNSLPGTLAALLQGTGLPDLARCLPVNLPRG